MTCASCSREVPEGMGLLSVNALWTPVSVSSWYAGASLLLPMSAIALAAFAFHVSLAGRPLFGGDLLGEAGEGRVGHEPGPR